MRGHLGTITLDSPAQFGACAQCKYPPVFLCLFKAMSQHPFDHEFERGLAMRRAAMGDAFVDRAIHQATAFNAEFQNFMTRYAWQGVWGRPGLDLKSRRLIVLAITSALGRWEEFDGHLRGALTAGNAGALTLDEVREALIQFAIYAGVPAANTAFVRATAVIKELGFELAPLPANQAVHPGVGRSVFTASRPKLHATVRVPRVPPRATLVLSHALGLDASMWDAVANTLAADCTVICPDTRGHGRSEVPHDALTMVDLAEDAARLLDELGERNVIHGPVVWVGISMGGMVGQELAVRHPGKLRALVLANTTAQYPEAGRVAIDERLSVVASQGLEAVAEGTMSRFFTGDFAARHTQTVARVQRLLLACDPEGYLACGAAVRDVDLSARLGQIKLPTLILAGDADQGTTPAMAQALQQGIAGSRLQTLVGCAHMSAVSHPQEFAQAVRGFIDAL